MRSLKKYGMLVVLISLFVALLAPCAAMAGDTLPIIVPPPPTEEPPTQGD
ncbi:MAG: hypothetical protein GTN49_05775 [candidate division Zixibacteria bacterium]|nr:hypothetical protein [candidate division Zixibacteria bacterium]